MQAIRRLRDFEERFVFKDHGPVTSDSKAKMGDESKSPSMILSALIKNLHAKVDFYLFIYLSTLTNLSQWAMNGWN